MVGIGVVYRRCVVCVCVGVGVRCAGVCVGTVYGAMALGVRMVYVVYVSCGVRVYGVRCVCRYIDVVSV